MAKFVGIAADLCETTLLAAADKIQIQLLSTIAPPYGRDVYMELRYRESPNRDKSVMNSYMEKMEKVSASILGVDRPRIRCFPQKNDQLFARN